MSFFGDPTDHPDCLDLEIAGKEVPFLLTKSALEDAKEKGIDLAGFRDLDEGDVLGNLDALATLLFVGTLPFEQEMPTKEDFDQVLTPSVAAEVGPRVMAQFEGLTDEEVEAVVGKE
jgi:hypothetical protein